MIPKLISIVVVTFNLYEYTKKCLGSIKKYSRQPYELIVVDNGSKDNTAQLVEGSCDRLIANERNLGYPGGCNQGIEAARGEYILLLNNDTIVTPNWLTNLKLCLTSSREVGIVSPLTNRVANPNFKVDVSFKNEAEIEHFTKEFNQHNPERWFEYHVLPGFCMMIKARVFRDTGKLDERYGLGLCEDYDLSLRARRVGYKLLCAGDTFVYHYRSRTFAGNNIDRERLLKKNTMIFKKKWDNS